MAAENKGELLEEFCHNFRLMLDLRFKEGIVLENIEAEYQEFNNERITLRDLDPHQNSWKGLFRSKEILKSNFKISSASKVDHVKSINMATTQAKKFIQLTNYKQMQEMLKTQDSTQHLNLTELNNPENNCKTLKLVELEHSKSCEVLKACKEEGVNADAVIGDEIPGPQCVPQLSASKLEKSDSVNTIADQGIVQLTNPEPEVISESDLTVENKIHSSVTVDKILRNAKQPAVKPCRKECQNTQTPGKRKSSTSDKNLEIVSAPKKSKTSLRDPGQNSKSITGQRSNKFTPDDSCTDNSADSKPSHTYSPPEPVQGKKIGPPSRVMDINKESRNTPTKPSQFEKKASNNIGGSSQVHRETGSFLTFCNKLGKAVSYTNREIILANPRSKAEKCWAGFLVQNVRQLSLYYSDSKGIVYRWNDGTWKSDFWKPFDRNVFMLPPKSCVYGEFVKFSIHNSVYSEFQIVDIGGIDGGRPRIDGEAFKAKCDEFFEQQKTQNRIRCVNIVMKSKTTVADLFNWKVFERLTYDETNTCFKHTRSNTIVVFDTLCLLPPWHKADEDDGKCHFRLDLTRRYTICQRELLDIMSNFQQRSSNLRYNNNSNRYSN